VNREGAKISFDASGMAWNANNAVYVTCASQRSKHRDCGSVRYDSLNNLLDSSFPAILLSGFGADGSADAKLPTQHSQSTRLAYDIAVTIHAVPFFQFRLFHFDPYRHPQAMHQRVGILRSQAPERFHVISGGKEDPGAWEERVNNSFCKSFCNDNARRFT